MAVGKLKRISNSIPMEFLRQKGDKGDPGRPGRDGKDGIDGESIMGPPGKNGKDGRDGKDGKTEIRHVFQDLPPDLVTKQALTDLKKQFDREIEMLKVSGSSGGGGLISNNTYTKIEQAEYHINKSQLSLGTNIFGVNFEGDVCIFLPKNIDKRSHIVINDESGNAGTYNITTKVES